MRTRLHKIFLIFAAVAYAILWLGSNVGPLSRLIRESRILEALVAALVFDLLWQLISREDAEKQAARTDALVRAELDRQGTLLMSVLPLLGVKAGASGALLPPQARRLVEVGASELTDVAARGQIRIRGRHAVLDEALTVIRSSERQAFTKNHIPPLVWKRDPAGRKVTEYLEEQQRAAASHGLIRIHIYDEASLPAWSDEEWDALAWLNAQHAGSLEFRLCSAAWDRRSSEFESKGLVLGYPGGIGTLLVFEQPYIGTTEGRLVWANDTVEAARHHLAMLLQHSETFDSFAPSHRKDHKSNRSVFIEDRPSV
jgi:hypothetical protein